MENSKRASCYGPYITSQAGNVCFAIWQFILLFEVQCVVLTSSRSTENSWRDVVSKFMGIRMHVQAKRCFFFLFFFFLVPTSIPGTLESSSSLRTVQIISSSHSLSCKVPLVWIRKGLLCTSRATAAEEAGIGFTCIACLQVQENIVVKIIDRRTLRSS